MATLSFEGVKKSYGNVQVVHGLDMQIADGELVVLVGPSGCGKSTLLRMIAGLEEITDGTIVIDGKVVNALAPKERDISMVFQNYALYPHMTVEQNMAFSMTLAGAPKEEKARRVRHAAEILDLHPLLHRKPRQLSGGQRQRVAMGRSIVRDPKIFLFDEPLSNLDAKLRVQMRSEIRALHRRLGTTMVYVTHDQVEAMTMADRIVVMQDGRIEQVGTPLEVYDEPANVFVAQFIGSPSMNLLEARVSGGRVVLNGGIDTGLAAPAGVEEGSDILLGKRPEEIALGTEGALEVTVESIEPTGADTFVVVHFGSAPLSVMLRDRPAFREGETVRARIDAGAGHIFDHHTGRRFA